MPIRLNLLAEDHALEEERRRDPVKRAYLVAGLVVLAVVAWCAVLQARIMASRSHLGDLKSTWQSMAKDYEIAEANQRQVIETEQKLTALQSLTTNRFLWGTALNALQQSIRDIEDLRVTRLKCSQVYTESEEVPSTTRNGVVVPAKPAKATERISMLIDGVDASPEPGGANVNKFKQALSQVPYFKDNLTQTNGVLLTSLSAPQVSPQTRQPFVTFSLQASFPEKVR